MKKVAKISEDIEKDNLQKLREIFPQFVKDGKVDLGSFEAFFASERILAGTEKYGLNWAGKGSAFKAIRTPSTGTLVPQEKESKNFAETENIFIEGDNLEVLKLLQKHYREQIKMIYIDPPYNTGKDFIYTDNFTENKNDYYERTGQSCDGIKLTSNPESNGRYHSDWLTMMYPRLFLARNLMREDGVIFVSIDDHEVANLRMIMDEIFGEENFVASIIWERAFAPKNDSKYFSENHDYILIYAKQLESFNVKMLPRTAEADARYKNYDNDPRGLWISDNLTVKTYSAKNDYPVTTPGGRVVSPAQGRCWSVSKEKFSELEEDNRIWFGEDKNNVPRLKRFLTDVSDGMTPITLWKHVEVGHSQEGRQELKELFDDQGYFDGPKPLRLLKRILQLSTSENDIVLDFFAGSGTTAHAVMDLNAEDGGNRKWICVQIPEGTNVDSEACKAGYLNIAQISRERIRRAGVKIAKGDTGFKAFSLSSSNYSEWNVLTDKDDEATLKKQSKLFIEQPLVIGFNEKSVVYEILLKEGYDLNAKVEQAKGDLAPWIVTTGDKKLVVTFAKKVTKSQVESLGLSELDTLVCLDSALDDTAKVNIMRNLTVKVI